MHVNAIKVIDYLLNNEWKISTFFSESTFNDLCILGVNATSS